MKVQTYQNSVIGRKFVLFSLERALSRCVGRVDSRLEVVTQLLDDVQTECWQRSENTLINIKRKHRKSTQDNIRFISYINERSSSAVKKTDLSRHGRMLMMNCSQTSWRNRFRFSAFKTVSRNMRRSTIVICISRVLSLCCGEIWLLIDNLSTTMPLAFYNE